MLHFSSIFTIRKERALETVFVYEENTDRKSHGTRKTHFSATARYALARTKKKKKIGISESLESCEYLFLTCQYERTYNCDRLLPLDIIYQLHGNGISSSRSIRHASNERVVRGNRAVASVYVKRIP